MHCPSANPSRVRAEWLEAVESILPRGFDRIMPAMTGAMANEIAISMARLRRPRGRIVSFSGSYFGRSVGTVGLAGKSYYRDAIGVASDAAFLPFPQVRTMGPDASDQVINMLKSLTGPAGGLGELAAIILEPVQGNGGVIVPPPDFFPRLREYCDETGTLLITDEIQSGCGRSGKMWAAENFGVVPDILTIGKGIGGGMAVAAVATRGDIIKWPADSYSSTFIVNNLNLAASAAAIDVMKTEKLAARAATLSPKYDKILKQRLSGMSGVADIRSFGLWYAVELEDVGGRKGAQSAQEILRALRARGIVAGPGGYAGNAVKLQPPLVIEESDLDSGVDAVCEEISDWSKSL
jgi:4-aminobutyrate aminotransferase-like enzyme